MESYSSIEQLEALSRLTERRKKRRRRKKRMVAILSVILILLVGTVIVLELTHKAPSESDKPFELPASVQLQPLVLADNVPVSATDFVLGLGGTGLRVTFAEEPDPSALGQQDIKLVFKGENGSCTRTASLYRFRLEPKATAVMGGEAADIRDFVPDETVDAVFLGRSPAQIPADLCGEFPLQISCGGREYGVTYTITEEIPPQATALEVTTGASIIPDPATLVTDIVDHSAVTVTYLEEPVLNMVGRYPVTVVLTDAYGNSAQIESVIHVIPAENGPQFTGLEELRIQVGDTIAYKAGVTATDAQDGELTYTVDAGGVDNKVEGTYTAYYTATDSDGLTITVARTITVLDVQTAVVEQYAAAALDQIITPDMTRDQKIFAVYKYTKANVSFVGTSDKTSIIHGAYEGFTTGKGDCYTYYAMNVIMLNLLGIENLEVRRTGGETNHWWNLVLHEDGKYYHVDSCPVAVEVEGVFHWKMTDTDLVTYTEGVSWRKINFYTYDKTLPQYEGITIAP